nr:RHS repeat-associated core domain-containing protein [uncultured Coprobacter sp.]
MTAYDIQSYDSFLQITFYEYDAYGRLVKKTDPMNLVTQWQYDIYGNMVRETDPEGLHTYYEYDGLGRTLRTVYPDSTETVVTYAWASGTESALTEITTTHTGKPTEKLFQDALGREVRKGAQRFDGHYLFTDKVYNQHGLLEKESLPFRSQSPSAWNRMTYDFHDRLVRTDYASGRTDVYDYGQNTVTETKKGITVSKTFDAVGRVIRVSDTAGDIQYTLRPDGQPESITAPGNITTAFTYNVYGQKIRMDDPSAGTIEWGYGPFGNQTYKKDANGVETRTLYDRYGRKDSINISKDNKELRTVKFGYDNYNRLSQVVENTGSRFYKYDRYGRLSEDIQYIDDYFSLERKYAYNELGQISWINYYGYLPCTIGRVHYTYANGHKTEIKVDASAPAWKLVAENDMGLPVSIETGPLTRTFEYDRYGFPLRRTVTCGDRIIQDMSTRFDSHTGNLTWRQDNTRNIREDFSYDALNRLTGFNGKTVTYDGKGNIIDHSGVGSFEYAEDRPYTIEYVTPYGDYVPEAAQEITYNELLRPQKIVEGDIETSFQYDYDGNFNYERIEGINSLGKEFFREHFSWDNKYEELNGYHFGGVLYLDGDVFSATTAWCTSPIGGENEWEYLYICRDYMGSITHVIDKSGNVLQELSYDPWGRFRDPDTQELYAPGETPELLLLRGYCGHKHVEYHGLIHMNARLYDPVIGRFLSPDPYVQMPDFSQNFNRYTYCLNNPLVYKDENGEFIQFIVGALVGALVNYTGQVVRNVIEWSMQPKDEKMSWKDIFFKKIDFFDVGISAAVGAVTGGFMATTVANSTATIAAKHTLKIASLSVQLASPVVTNAIDFTPQKGWEIVDNGNKFLTGIATDYAFLGISRWIGKSLPFGKVRKEIVSSATTGIISPSASYGVEVGVNVWQKKVYERLIPPYPVPYLPSTSLWENMALDLSIH